MNKDSKDSEICFLTIEKGREYNENEYLVD